MALEITVEAVLRLRFSKKLFFLVAYIVAQLIAPSENKRRLQA